MNQHRNWSLWVGFLLVLAGALSYIPVFARFPATRDFPSVNLALFAVGGVLMGIGLTRAFRQPTLYRGKVSGSLAAALSVVLCGLFVFAFYFMGRQVPDATGAPRIGEKAPDFTLPDQHGTPVGLAGLLGAPARGQPLKAKVRGAVLIFYRGHW